MEDTITISPQAIAQIKKQNITASDYVRIGLKSSGCNGFELVIKYEERPKETDQHFVSHDIKMIVDPKSFLYLKGSTLDWENTIMKQGFVLHSPQQKSSCGCGKSMGF